MHLQDVEGLAWIGQHLVPGLCELGLDHGLNRQIAVRGISNLEEDRSLLAAFRVEKDGGRHLRLHVEVFVFQGDLGRGAAETNHQAGQERASQDGDGAGGFHGRWVLTREMESRRGFLAGCDGRGLRRQRR